MLAAAGDGRRKHAGCPDDRYWLRLSPHVASEMEASLLPLLMQKPQTVTCAVTANRQPVSGWIFCTRGSIRWC